MKMLYIHNQAKKVNNFSHSSMMAAKKLDIEFHIASNWGYNSCEERIEDEKKYGIKIHQIDFIRRPYDLRNIKAYKQVCDLIKKEKYDVIHCNTPIGGVIGRLAGKKCGVNHVIYQAHGFHFYKGASVLNWLIYYPIEKILARYTDSLITINNEDYEFAKKKIRLKNNGNVIFINGVGVCDIKDVPTKEIRSELGIREDDFICISVGDLIKRKNYETLIKAINFCTDDKIKLIVCGEGPRRKKLEKLALKLGVESQVFFLGYRSDITELLSNSDCYVFSTEQEGLPRSLMEAMVVGLPCIVSDIRGNIDLIKDESGGYIVNALDYKAFARQIEILSKNREMREKMGLFNREYIEKYKLEKVIEETVNFYSNIQQKKQER